MKVRLKIQLLDKMETKGAFNSQANYVDLVNLIRSVQLAEGQIDCYRRGRQQCDRMACAWRDHCLKEPEVSATGDCDSHASKNAADPKRKQDGLRLSPEWKGLR